MIKVTKTAIAEVLPDMRYLRNPHRYQFVGAPGVTYDTTRTIEAVSLCICEDKIVCDVITDGEAREEPQGLVLLVDITKVIRSAVHHYITGNKQRLAAGIADELRALLDAEPNAFYVIINDNFKATVVDYHTSH